MTGGDDYASDSADVASQRQFQGASGQVEYLNDPVGGAWMKIINHNESIIIIIISRLVCLDHRLLWAAPYFSRHSGV